jgi:hypothetical protein
VSWSLSSFAVGVVQVRASQGRRGRDTGPYVDRGERREVRAWAARTVKRLRLRGTGHLKPGLPAPMAVLLIFGWTPRA